MVELFSSVPYILDNTPFISFNFIHVIKSTVYVIFVRILIVLFFHIFHIKILLSTNVTVQNKNLFYNVKSGYALNRISAPNSFKPQITFPYIFSATLIIFNYPAIFWGIIRMYEQVAASGNTLILYSAWLLFIWYINHGKGFPRSGACTLAADLYTGYPSPSRRRKSIHPFPMAVESLCRNTLALSLPSCYLCFEIHKPFVLLALSCCLLPQSLHWLIRILLYSVLIAYAGLSFL